MLQTLEAEVHYISLKDCLRENSAGAWKPRLTAFLVWIDLYVLVFLPFSAIIAALPKLPIRVLRLRKLEFLLFPFGTTGFNLLEVRVRVAFDG